MIRHVRAGAIATCLGGLATPAIAQESRSVTVEAASEEERRGLSWSEGRAVLAGDLRVALAGLDASARAVTLRRSARHGDAEAVVDLALGTGWSLGAVGLRAQATAHAFAGARGRMDYVEAGVSANYAFGPLFAVVGVTAAPSQRAIGGSNVHVYANANAGIPGTPFTVLADIGHSSGSTNDGVRAERLRPGGAYSNWRLGVERRRDRLTIGVDYIGTDISGGASAGSFADRRNATDRIIGRVQLSF